MSICQFARSLANGRSEGSPRPSPLFSSRGSHELRLPPPARPNQGEPMPENSSGRINDARNRIDQLDEQIIALLADRMVVCASIAGIKREEGIPMMQPNR